MKKIEFFKHNVGKEEKRAVATCLDGRFLTTGGQTAKFEREFSFYTGVDWSLGTMSCTHALELALKCLGIGPGSSVITTPLTFAATTLAILRVGAIPIWVDVSEHTGNMIPYPALYKNLQWGSRSAILPVHLYGQQLDVEGFAALADNYSAAFIEDAAHALECPSVGHYSDAACYSFYPTKSITCGEGGAVVTMNEELYNRMKINRTHGMSADASDRYTTHFRHWDIVDLGMKCNMNDIQASMLIPQLSKVQKYKKARRAIFERYYEAFCKNKNIRLLKVDWNTHAFHLFTILVDPCKRDAILEELQNRNIGVAVNYRSVNTLTAFKFMNKPRGSFPNAERIGDSTISLPLYPKLTRKEVEYIIKNVLEVVN